MGRVGFEPTTLGLKVLPRRLKVDAVAGSCLQVARRSTAAKCTELQVTETVRYSTPYSRTADSARNCDESTGESAWSLSWVLAD